MTGSGRATIETLQRLLDAFNAHDLDAVMSFFVDDPVLELPRGPHPRGRRFQGREEVRSGLASRFAGLPDVHYGGTVTGSAATGAARSGCSPGRPPRGTGSRCGAATCSSSGAPRSPARTPTGSSSSDDARPSKARSSCLRADDPQNLSTELMTALVPEICQQRCHAQPHAAPRPTPGQRFSPAQLCGHVVCCVVG
jgi:hypothetical protein